MMDLVPKPTCLHGRPWDECPDCEEPTRPEASVPMADLLRQGRESAPDVSAPRTRTKRWPPGTL